jgi:hypothetical protein
MELPLSRNSEERGWKPKSSKGKRSEGSGPFAMADTAATKKRNAKMERRRRCCVGLGASGTGMALGAYLYTIDIA